MILESPTTVKFDLARPSADAAMTSGFDTFFAQLTHQVGQLHVRLFQRAYTLSSTGKATLGFDFEEPAGSWSV